MAYNKKDYRRSRIKNRIRKIVNGTPTRPRMSVYRSNRDIYVQLIDDVAGVTLASASSKIAGIGEQKITKCQKSALVGKEIAQRALAAGINEVIFDRNGYLYHGRVKSLADAAREGGLKF